VLACTPELKFRLHIRKLRHAPVGVPAPDRGP
jgi:hypothetical protein